MFVSLTVIYLESDSVDDRHGQMQMLWLSHCVVMVTVDWIVDWIAMIGSHHLFDGGFAVNGRSRIGQMHWIWNRHRGLIKKEGLRS